MSLFQRVRLPSRGARGIAWFLVTLAATSLALSAAKLTGSSTLAVAEKGGENIRDSQNGEKIGTLLGGTEVEVLEQDGKWVHFRLEGWIWGPSLDGFEEEEAVDERVAGKERRKARPALQKHLPKIKKTVNDQYGVFYGISVDRDLGQLVVRFRVTRISREALEHRQMAVQREVVRILEGVEYRSVRVETNRPDGSGQVGVEIAVTDVADIDSGAGGDGGDGGTVEEWKRRTRLSSDSGQSWSR